MTESPRQRAAFVLLFFYIVALLLLFSDKGQIAGDGLVRWKALQALMEEHRLTPDRYSIVQPLLAAPLYLAADAYWRLRPGPEGSPEDSRMAFIGRIVQRFNKLVALATAIWFFVTLRRVFGFALRGAALGTLFLLFGSTLIPNARDFYSECLWTLLAAVAVSAWTSHRAPGLFFAATALAIPLNPLLAPVLGSVFLLTWWREDERRPRMLIPGGGAVAAGVFLALLENRVRRGDFLAFGYAGFGFDTPFWTGFVGQIASPARGLLFYMPAFLLGAVLAARRGLKRGERGFIVASLLFSSLLVFGYSKWCAWHGAMYWGPRFLLPLSVFAALYLAVFSRGVLRSRSRRAAAVACVAGLLSYIVYKVGAAISVTHMLECLEDAGAGEACYWKWVQLPYASLFDRVELRELVLHRSTLVDLSTLFLVFGLDRWAASRGWPLWSEAHGDA